MAASEKMKRATAQIGMKHGVKMDLTAGKPTHKAMGVVPSPERGGARLVKRPVKGTRY